jgi:hypothetical protein
MDAIKAKFKVMIVCETTRRNGSDVYTKPMCNSLRDNLPLCCLLSFSGYVVSLITLRAPHDLRACNVLNFVSSAVWTMRPLCS